MDNSGDGEGMRRGMLDCMVKSTQYGMGISFSFCNLAQDQEAAMMKADAVEEALNIKATLEVLGRRYPELGVLLNQIVKKEVG